MVTLCWQRWRLFSTALREAQVCEWRNSPNLPRLLLLCLAYPLSLAISCLAPPALTYASSFCYVMPETNSLSLHSHDEVFDRAGRGSGEDGGEGVLPVTVLAPALLELLMTVLIMVLVRKLSSM